MKLDLQYFAEDQTETTDTITEATGATEQAETTEGTAAEPKNTDTKPAENMIPYDRFKEVNESLRAFKELGFDTPEKAQQTLADFEALQKAEQERKRAEMSEVERLQADLKAKEEAEQTAAQKLAEYQEAVKTEKVRNAFIVAAQQAGIEYVDDAYKLADFSAVEVGEDGAVNGVKEVVAKMIEDKPFLKRQETQQPRDIGGGTGGQKADEKVRTLEQQLEEARQNKDFSAVVKLSNQINDLK